MAEVYGNIVIVVILVMEGVDRAVMLAASDAGVRRLMGGLSEHEGSEPLPVAARAVTDL